ncbi:unnamed protein product, partial [Iphiclides podalirius]
MLHDGSIAADRRPRLAVTARFALSVNSIQDSPPSVKEWNGSVASDRGEGGACTTIFNRRNPPFHSPRIAGPPIGYGARQKNEIEPLKFTQAPAEATTGKTGGKELFRQLAKAKEQTIAQSDHKLHVNPICGGALPGRSASTAPGQYEPD